MKLKIFYNNNTSKEIEIDKIDVMPSPRTGCANLNIIGTKNNKVNIIVSSNLIPDTAFLDKIEISE